MGIDWFVYAGGAACRRFGFHKKRLTRVNLMKRRKIRGLRFLSFTGEFSGLKAPQKTPRRGKKSVKASKMCDSASLTSILIIASDAGTSVNKPDLKNLNWC